MGKEVIDLLDVSVQYDGRTVLRNIEWRIAPGERAGILGVNGAGKSTLLNLITGALQPTTGTVKRGKTVKVATLTQQTHELDAVANDRVREVLARKRLTYSVGGKEMTSSQLLEQLGFKNEHMSSPVKELSGGQRRRLQLLLILLDEPNVLVMDEPTNDLDTDMLAAIEDLLDTWPGTLLVVSHDRYLLERITDQQYAILDGQLRHLPGGVDEYVKLRHGQTYEGSSNGFDKTGGNQSRLSNIELRQVQKETTAIERKLAKIPAQIEAAQARIDNHDQSDYIGLTELAEALNGLRQRQADLEHRWLELSELTD